MRFSIVVLFAASLVSAVSLLRRHDDSEVPRNPGDCQWDDTACLCVNEKYYTAVANCVQSSCNPDDAKKGAEAGIKACKAVGIDPENPIPKCGVPCVEKTPTYCDPQDYKCLCQDQGFLESVVWCFKDCCSGEDLKNAKCAGEAYCRTV
ncbi:hypothetical protein FRC04_009990, partial [Tulasnella sp. 424]